MYKHNNLKQLLKFFFVTQANIMPLFYVQTNY